MFTKTLLAVALAGVIGAAGATAASAAQTGTNGANAYYKPTPGRSYAFEGGIGGPGWQLRFGDFRTFPQKPYKPVVQKVCGPSFKQVQVWKPGRGWVWDKVYTGQACRLEKIYPTKGYMHAW